MGRGGFDHDELSRYEGGRDLRVQGLRDGTRGDHFTLCPPLIITEEQIDQIIISIEETVKEIK